MASSRPTGTIQVEVEETLGHFAEWAGVRTQSIRRLNRLAFGKKLHLHQKVKIPLNKVTAQAFEENRYEFHKRLQEDFFAVYRIGELRSYRVKRGDTLWTLSLDKFDVPMWLLKSCNPKVDFAALRLRQVLRIPSIEKKAADEQEVEADTEPDTEPNTELDELDTLDFPNSVL
jgi:membrane-bound lytic murein transglycosylase D